MISELAGAGVYLVRCADMFKIGQTTDIRFRLAVLQTGNPYLLEVAMFVPCEFPTFECLERKLHKTFASQNIRREWYKLNRMDLKRVLDISKKYNEKPILIGPFAEEWKFPPKKGRT